LFSSSINDTIRGIFFLLMMIPTCVRFSEVSLKNVQISMQKIITWPKKFRKGKQKWKNSCIIVGSLPGC
jgi:hypothetical protein